MAPILSPLTLLLATAACLWAGATPGLWAMEPSNAAERNLQRLERAAAGAADSLLEAIAARDSLCLAVVTHDAAWMLEAAIIERAAARSVAVGRCDRAEARRLDVAITAIGVTYGRIDEGIERIASISLGASAPAPLATSGSAGELRTLRVAARVVDTLAVADTTGLADASYPYTVGVLATADSGGFWSRIVEPAVVLAASAIVAILLFTVRSR